MKIQRGHVKEPSDLGTNEARQQYSGRYKVGLTSENKRRVFVKSQVPLDSYRQRGSLTERQWDAGNRLYEQFVAGDIMRMGVSNLDAVRVDGGRRIDTNDGGEAAAEEYRRAVAHLQRNQVAHELVMNVCCYGYRLSDIDTQYYTLPAEKMNRLKEALDDLANYYRLPLNMG